MQQMRTRNRLPPASTIDPDAPASVVVRKFGGLARFCQLTGFATSTVHDWMVKGLIPAARQEHVLAVAAEHRIKVKPAEFVPTPKAA
jgi:hypothetical protein